MTQPSLVYVPGVRKALTKARIQCFLLPREGGEARHAHSSWWEGDQQATTCFLVSSVPEKGEGLDLEE